MVNLNCFSLKDIAQRLNSINIQINLQYQKPFPKPKEQMLSYYTYQNRWVKVFDNGYFNKARLVTSLIDFTFIRSENLSQDTLYKRGFNQDGTPYAPCGALCRPNGYDKEHKRLSFICGKQCLRCSGFVPKPITNCPHLAHSLGNKNLKSRPAIP